MDIVPLARSVTGLRMAGVMGTAVDMVKGVASGEGMAGAEVSAGEKITRAGEDGMVVLIP